MRIISKDHDYYDTALAYGADHSLVYQRETRRENGVRAEWGLALTNLPRLDEVFDHRIRHQDDHYTLHILLFCGQVLPFVVRDDRTVWGKPAKREVFWSLAALDAAIAKAATPIQTEYGRTTPRRHAFTRRAVQEIFTHRANALRLAEIHDQHGSPVILYRNVYRDIRSPDVETVIDPNLKEIGLQTQRDAFATFQDIAQYLGGVMRAQAPKTISLSDTERRDKHGMDKWSFRTRVR